MCCHTAAHVIKWLVRANVTAHTNHCVCVCTSEQYCARVDWATRAKEGWMQHVMRAVCPVCSRGRVDLWRSICHNMNPPAPCQPACLFGHWPRSRFVRIAIRMQQGEHSVRRTDARQPDLCRCCVGGKLRILLFKTKARYCICYQQDISVFLIILSFMVV